MENSCNPRRRSARKLCPQCNVASRRSFLALCRNCVRANVRATESASERENRLAYMRRWHEAHRDESRVRAKEYYQAHKEEIKKRKPHYSIWLGMKRRCQNPNDSKFAAYGGRGIKVEPTWENSYEKFHADIEQHLGPRPHELFTLDRIDVDGDYVISNLRWADKKTQSHNQRRSITHEVTLPAVRERLLGLEKLVDEVLVAYA